MKNTFITVTIGSEFNLTGDTYIGKGITTQMCRGKPFTTSFWVCQDGIQKIPVSLVCDDPIKPDCEDGSDETKARCQGEGDQNVTIVIGSYFLLGFSGVLLGKVTTLTVLHETLKKCLFQS